VYEVTHVQRAAHLEVADVDLDVAGDVAREDGDRDLALLDVELPAGAHAHGAAHVLDGHVHDHRLVGRDGVEVDVHRLPAPLVHLDLLDEDRVDLAVDVEVDEARDPHGAERLVEGARVDAHGQVQFLVVNDGGQSAPAP